VDSGGFIETEAGIEIHYRRLGHGPLKIIVPGRMYLLPGLASLERFDRELIFFDQRGRGRSTTIGDERHLGIDQELSDIEAIRAHFGFERIALIGWSYLGLVVAHYALKHPDRVDRIIQLGPLYPRRAPYARMQQDTIATRRSPDDMQRYDVLVDRMKHGEDTPAIREAAQTLLCRPQYADPDFTATLADDFYEMENERTDRVFGFQIPAVLKSLGNWDLRDQLSNLQAPMLIIHGAHDPIPMKSAEEWSQSVPNGRLMVARNAGHYPWDEEPEPVLDTMNAFLSER